MSMSLKTVSTGFAQVLQPAVAPAGRSGLRLMPRGTTEVGKKLKLAPRDRSRPGTKSAAMSTASGLIPNAGNDRAEVTLFAMIVGLSLAAVALGVSDSAGFAENWAAFTHAVSALIG